MEFQLHPSSPRGAVRRVSLGPRGEALAAAVAGIAAFLALSLWITVPATVRRVLRDREEASARDRELDARREREGLAMRAVGVRDRALDAGDRLSRIAFLYGVATARWPRALNPETGLLSGRDPASLAQGCGRYLVALERGRVLLEAVESDDADLAARTPSRLPLRSELVEPSALFGPRVSPWTGGEEFFPGVDLAAPMGSPVIAPAAGTVLFTGRANAAASRLARFGNLVVVSHGSAGVTLYGHLSRVDVRRGDRVARGRLLGSVGATGRAASPGLHYEYWRNAGGGRLEPTDPLFAILDRRLTRSDASLERMRATSAPGPIEPPPPSP